jgi:hypothetical protein
MKAVANVIAVIILLTITISLAGTAYVFFSGTVGSETSETFMILDVDENRIAVSNTGQSDINEFKTVLDGQEVSNTIDGGSIPAGDSGIVRIDSIEAGSHQLVLMSKSMSQKFNWQVYTSVGPSSTTSSTLGGSTTTVGGSTTTISTTTTSSTLGGSTTTISTTTTSSTLGGSTTTISTTTTTTPTLNWWNSNWQYRMLLKFNNLPSDSLINFPVMVKLDSGNFNYGHARTDGYDIRFIDADNTTILAYERESWNPSGDSYIWVKVPQISTSGNNYIWMYYGYSSAMDGEDITNVWDPDYVGVWHLNSIVSGNFLDSTSYANDAGALFDTSVTSVGKIDSAAHFDGTDDEINRGDSNSLDFGTSDFTLEAWVKTNSNSNDCIIEKGGTSLSTPGYFFWYSSGDDDLKLYVSDGTTRIHGDSDPFANNINDGSWWYMAAAADRSGSIYFYVNGTSVGSEDMSAIDGNSISNSRDFRISKDSTGWEWNGDIDEVRVSRVLRSPSWIETSYLTINNNFINYGPEES